MNCSLPGSSIHGIIQARILELVAIPFSRGSSQPRDQTLIFYIAGRFFTVWVTREIKLASSSIGPKMEKHWTQSYFLSYYLLAFLHMLDYKSAFFYSCCCSVVQSHPTLCDPFHWVHQASLSFTVSQGLLKVISIESMMPSNHLILCCSLLLLPTIFPTIRVFSSELALHIL